MPALVGAVGGGVIRDLLLGEPPPAAFRDRRCPLMALIGATGAIVASLVTGSVAHWTMPAITDFAVRVAAIAGYWSLPHLHQPCCRWLMNASRRNRITSSPLINR